MPRRAAAAAVVVGIVLAVVFIPGGTASHPTAAPSPKLPPPWRVKVTVLNGAGDMTYTRQVAATCSRSRTWSKKVARADSFAYQRTSVFYPPGARASQGASRSSSPSRRSRSRRDGAVPALRDRRARTRARLSLPMQRRPQLGELLLQLRRHRLVTACRTNWRRCSSNR